MATAFPLASVVAGMVIGQMCVPDRPRRARCASVAIAFPLASVAVGTVFGVSFSLHAARLCGPLCGCLGLVCSGAHPRRAQCASVAAAISLASVAASTMIGRSVACWGAVTTIGGSHPHRAAAVEFSLSWRLYCLTCAGAVGSDGDHSLAGVG